MTARTHRYVVDIVQQAVRIAWQHDAEKAGLRPVAAWWRWRALMQKHPVWWLKEPWKAE